MSKPETLYKHRQVGVATVAALGLGALVCLGFSLAVGSPDARIILLAIAGVLAISAVLFCTLTVELSRDSLSWYFGPGVLRKKVPITDIKDAAVTKTRFIHGWGVHLTARGWLYNVSGFGAVAITLKSGKRFLLGSDEPEQLCSVIRGAVK